MVLNRFNQRTFFKNLYRGTGSLITITYRKRNADQGMGTTTDYELPNCRMKKSFRTNEIVTEDMTADDQTVWQIPLKSLEDAGLSALTTGRPQFGDMILNNIDANSESYGTTWMVEATDLVVQQLYGDCYNLSCRRHS